MPKGAPKKRYSGEFKQKVVEDLRVNMLSYREAAKKYGIPHHDSVMTWERIYLEEGLEGLYIDRRCQASAASGGIGKGRKPKLDEKVKDDLIAENQRLRAEIDYLKKLNALVTERVQREKKHRS